MAPVNDNKGVIADNHNNYSPHWMEISVLRDENTNPVR